MLKINKITSNSTVDYAAEELKKYLRMMMPEGGDIKISYDPEAKDGFRLGLMQDFGLDVSDAENPELDDILYVNCDTCGGIIAGDNPRSVLLAVYEYLRQNGCRWLFPGVDGEFIPMQNIKPVKYRHKPSMRYRGMCNEGAEFQQSVLATIEFLPKVGMNIFMIEFENPFVYYRGYYNHYKNEKNRPPELISETTALQWKRQCEAEIEKRGMMIHDIGHGFTVAPFGIRTDMGWNPISEEQVPADAFKYLAFFDGRRKLYRDRPLCTQFCMSNPEARATVTDYIVKYAKEHSYVDYLHVWLADDTMNHCECDACRKKTPSDWYAILLNEIDSRMTSEGLGNRIVFCMYTDTTWAPLTEAIKNSNRFSMLFAAISRSYTKTVDSEDKDIPLTPFVLNKSKMPSTLAEYFNHLKNWRKHFGGKVMAYEYHFCIPISHDPSGIMLAKRIYEDVTAYFDEGIDGIIQDGTQRCYFPTGFAVYAYARKMFDIALPYDEIRDDYFSTAFGDGADRVYGYLEALGQAFDQKYLSQRTSGIPTHISDSDYLENLKEIQRLGDEGENLIKEYYNSDYRIRTVSVRLLEKHLEMYRLFTSLLKDLWEGKINAEEALDTFCTDFGKHECEIQLYFDHAMFANFLKRLYDASQISNNVTELV